MWLLQTSRRHYRRRDTRLTAHVQRSYGISIREHGTCRVCRLKALPLHRGVRDETQVHLVSGGDQRLWDFTATQSTQDGCRVTVAVKGLQMVVRTLLMLLDLELAEGLRRRRQRGEDAELSPKPTDVLSNMIFCMEICQEC